MNMRVAQSDCGPVVPPLALRQGKIESMRKPIRPHRLGAIVLVALVCLIPCGVPAQRNMADDWNRPVKPFRIVGNVYYVGASEVSSFLITTPEGHILLDSGLPETVPLIREGFKQLGFKLEDVKWLINSHAHFDHAGGLAELKTLTGAKLAATEADAAQLALGGKDDFTWGDTLAFPPVKTDRILRDGDTIKLGGVTMTARLTPGHTKGNTTWTIKVKDGAKTYDVVFVGSTSAPGYQLVDNPKYPNIVADYQRSFSLLKSLPCDVFLGPHGSFFGLLDKAAKLEQGAKTNPFIDPQGYRRYLETSEKNFYEQLKKEQPAPPQVIKEKGKFSRVPAQYRDRLIERLNAYVWYERTNQYDKLFDLLPDEVSTGTPFNRAEFIQRKQSANRQGRDYTQLELKILDVDKDSGRGEDFYMIAIHEKVYDKGQLYQLENNFYWAYLKNGEWFVVHVHVEI